MKGNFMVNKFFSFFLFSFFLIFVSSAHSATKDKPPKKWPCDQVYNPQLNLSTIWQGPSIESALKDWWKHDDVIEYVNKLSDPTLNEEVGKQLINEFAKKYTYAGLIKKAEQKENDSNHIQEFTKDVKSLSMENKIIIIETLWRIILSDGKSDIYENNLMRRLAGLLYLDDKIVGEIRVKVLNNK